MGRGAVRVVGVEAAVTLEASWLAGNVGLTGGALHMGERGLVTLRDCHLEANLGLEAGGAVYVAGAESTVVIANCSFVRNGGEQEGGENDATTGLQGGALYLSLSENSTSRLRVTNTSLLGNDASEGAGLYLAGQTDAWQLELVGLSFVGQRARLSGDCIFWLYGGNSTLVPTCEACTCDGSHGSSVVSVQGQQLRADGRWASVSMIVADSQVALQPAIRYVALDYYGGIVQMPATGSASVVASLLAHPDSTDDGLYFEAGSTVGLYDSAGAIFRSLVLAGTPGERYMLVLESIQQSWPSAVVEVRLRECVVGEQYDSKAQTCTECPSGYLKFDNSSAACTQCQSGLPSDGSRRPACVPASPALPSRSQQRSHASPPGCGRTI
ncbi:hypothetical protein CYMTET_36213 [Cymbomonas tetramitiformis]|uniref:Right handed beta helix domain-containing protein n=1 Tax=Cymbomonas tetramitiformis TaxID=36881 RepID=A0AAE0F7K5_9CHLO|nr:hypothetical protein CYMTET_36213 [Cymbomonas tetramitiformis]